MADVRRPGQQPLDGDAAAAERLPFRVRIEVGDSEVSIGVGAGIFESDYGTAAGVLVELGRRLVDMQPGKLVIEIDRKDVP